MINQLRVLALIPARGGSKGIKDKNIIPLAGKPLIQYSIDAARGSAYVDSVVVTTDAEHISSVAKEHGARVPFLRPAELAQDKSKTVDAVVHAITALQDAGEYYDVIVLLQPTQPARTSQDIDAALELFVANNQMSVVSICEVEKHPLLMRTIQEDARVVPLSGQRSDVRRQDMDTYFAVNGAIYINKVQEVTIETSFNDNVIGYVMPRERSVDIDEPLDLEIAEVFLKWKRS